MVNNLPHDGFHQEPWRGRRPNHQRAVLRGPQTAAAGVTVTLDLFKADGSGSLGHLETTTDADGNYRFLNVPPNSPFQPPFSAQDGNGYLLTVVAPVCGGSRDIDDSGMTAVQAGRTTNTNFLFVCS